MTRRCLYLVERARPDPGEQLLSAICINHGTRHRGNLVITTHWLRFFEGVVFKHDHKWPLRTTIMSDESHGPIGFIALGATDLFQCRGLSRKWVGNFVELYNALQQATSWEEHRTVDEVGASQEVEDEERFGS